MFQEISESCLPSQFINVIKSIDKNKVIIRSSLKTMEDINNWVHTFSRNSFTQWISRSSRPAGERIVCSKKFLCHQSEFNKVGATENKKGLSKNASCKASMLVVIKLNNPRTKRTDEFIKKGMQGVITISTEHSHCLRSAESVRFLQANEDMKNIFFKYFNDGMTISEAKLYHESLYGLKEDKDKELHLASGSSNPTYRCVQNWYSTWRAANSVAKKSGVWSEKSENNNDDTPSFPFEPIVNIISGEENEGSNNSITFKSLNLPLSQSVQDNDSSSDPPVS